LKGSLYYVLFCFHIHILTPSIFMLLVLLLLHVLIKNNFVAHLILPVQDNSNGTVCKVLFEVI
jgi:hypothetical protein